MKKSRFTEAQIVAILGQAKKGEMPIAELCRVHGIAESALYRWRKRYGDLEVSEVRRLRELEAENARLKRLLAERELKLDAIRETLRGKMGGAPAKRQAVRELVAAGLSEAAACRALQISRSSFRYVSRRPDETELVEAIKKIRERKTRWGYKRVHARLRRDGYAVNQRRSGDTVPVSAEHANHVFTLRLHLRRHRRRQASQGAHRAR